MSCADDDVSPRMASFRGAGKDAGSWKMKPMQGSTRRAVKWGAGNGGYYPGTARQGAREIERHEPRWTSGPAQTFTVPLKLRPSAKFRQYPSPSQSTSFPGSSLSCRASSVQGVRGSVDIMSSWTA